MNELVITPNFTVDDIHKIREWNYERRKEMTFEEYQADVQKGVNEALEIMARLKSEKEKAITM